MPHAAQDRIFERFYKVDRQGRPEAGGGIGPDCRSRATSSSSTAAGSGWSRKRVAARRSVRPADRRAPERMSGSGGGPLRIAHRGDARAARENAAGPACGAARAGLRRPGVRRPSVRSRPCPAPRRDAGSGLRRPEGVGELTAAALEEVGVPALADVLSALPHRAFLDVELKGVHDRAVVEVLASGRGPALQHAVVSSFDPRLWSVSAASCRAGRAGSTSTTSSRRRSPSRSSSTSSRDRRRVACHRRGRRSVGSATPT